MRRACVVFGRHINALSLMRGLRLIEGCRAVRYGGRRGYPDIPPRSTLFFTEEASLEFFALSRPNDYYFYPTGYKTSWVDKYLLARELETAGLPVVPYSPMIEPLETVSLPFPWLVKTARSWRGSRKLPRGKVCYTLEETKAYLVELKRLGIPLDWIFIQQWLPSAISVSVSGFFDPREVQRCLFLATHKSMSDVPELGTGVIVKTIPLSSELQNLAFDILSAIRFEGVFELEFLHEPESGQWYCLELNPRFWLQHSIFIEAYENALIRTYLFPEWLPMQDTNRDGVAVPYKPLAWVDTYYLITATRRRFWSRIRHYWNAIRNARKEGFEVIPEPRLLGLSHLFLEKTKDHLFYSSLKPSLRR